MQKYFFIYYKILMLGLGRVCKKVSEFLDDSIVQNEGLYFTVHSFISMLSVCGSVWVWLNVTSSKEHAYVRRTHIQYSIVEKEK